MNSAETTAKPPASPLLSADPKATLTFSAEKDGTLRVIYSGWDDGGVKTFRPGEWVEVVTRNGQVQVFRRGVAFLGPVPDPYLNWDLTPQVAPIEIIGLTAHDCAAIAAGTPLADYEIVEGSPLEPIGTVR